MSGEIQGELQEQIMAALWRTGPGTVEHVREGLPTRHRSAYTTVQTVLNRLSERGLVSRSRQGRTMTYAATLSEAQYLSQSLERTLAGASLEARRVALTELIGGLEADELLQLSEQAQRARNAAKNAR
ncbi:BlaI/MecI/CopY family transcriptional regulator [Patulibacter brassicae]|uniref:BlaI/MecI/CopY family transcriptional regulator n=1 Tax=Patulibacter brassicae TaxID=1705717 RepID=A0ABU4VR72_9ACTN|nr:BlaI/MecI/CopY family transcriptional regulator [Patulibacter brassicae]MDX8153393.1 BlaI/MecI/CopY family transcriptional regulator [Patulibacter brassicae]